MEKLLDTDKMIFCISAWNDNGFEKYANSSFFLKIDPSIFRHTDFFPGLGFMISNDFWQEIKTDWPSVYWDEYLRKKEVVKSRTCIYPEISRVKNLGLFGVSGGEYYLKYVEPIIKNTKEIDYKKVTFFNIDKFS